ncbi:hypothetical protein DVH24_028554 [Malus domestica]|uniref:Uncharacterized protein n=1 Tax=Malus domestica TaxID=3750 RepID=A0A498IY47_MALDO|nr:hypothetical protein DVH24_028554 [Malus domestica]
MCECIKQPHAPVKADWEVAVEKLADSTFTRLDQADQGIHNIHKSIKKNMVHQWKEQGEEEFPSQPITNPQCSKECCIIQPSQFVESYNNILGDIEIKEPSTLLIKVLVAELNKPKVEPIKFQECQGQFYEQAKFYKGKHEELSDSQILRQEIQPVQKLWMLNTRFKSVQWIRKSHCRGFYLITKIHSQRRPNMMDSTTPLKHIIDKHLIPYLLLPCDVVKIWLTLRDQVT